MVSFRDMVKGNASAAADRLKGVEKLQDEFPLVSEALAGAVGQNGQKDEEGCTISFWMDGPRMKFKIYVKFTFTSFFGEVADILNPWGSVNSALLTGDVSQKRDSGKGNTNGTPTH